MKTKLPVMIVAAACAALAGFGMVRDVTAAPVPQQVASPVGRIVMVQLVAWPLGTAVAGTVQGTLIAMPAGWLVVQEGSYEHWVPVEKVMSMKVSR